MPPTALAGSPGTAIESMAAMTSVEELRLLISLLYDGARGFRELAGYMREASSRAFFQEEARVRAVFANELERLVNSTARDQVQSDGTAMGTLHRHWIGLVGGSGASDRSLIKTTHMCERLIVRRYESLLSLAELNGTLRELVWEQSRHVHRAQALLSALE